MKNKAFKHTPGPWEYSHYRASIRSKLGLVGVFHRGNGMDVACADAVLVAAAPELLSACKSALRIIRYSDIHHRAASKLSRAISKAEGRR